MNLQINETVQKVKIQSERKYQKIWNTVAEKADRNDFTPTIVKISQLTDSTFKTIRKAFWKEKDIDKHRGQKWLSKCVRGNSSEGTQDLIYFSVLSKKIEDRI